MRVTDTRSTTVKTYRLTVEDGEVRDQTYSRAGRQYRVQHITVIKRDGNVSHVEVAGAVLKKDGTVGLNVTTEKFYNQGSWPVWLRSIIGGLA